VRDGETQPLPIHISTAPPNVALQLSNEVRIASAARSLLFDSFAAELERWADAWLPARPDIRLAPVVFRGALTHR